MRRVLTLALPLFVLALTACPGKPKDGKCASDKDCAAQQGYGKVCVQGSCQECGQDNDCPAGFACRENKCAPRTECDQSRPCPGGKACEAGRCVEPQASGLDTGAGAAAAPAAAACKLQNVQFDFDDANLRGDARDVLAKDADCLKQLKPKKVVVGGHCDERGTNKYDQHLGQRRAESVRRYLVNLGLDAGGLDTVSFGEEQPVCQEATEDCWKQNRHAELSVK
jgi:peptidoglycan-associated lipoprotein